MEEDFRKVKEQHTYNTRSSQNIFVIPKIKGVESTTFCYNAISFPGHIKEKKQILTNLIVRK